MVPFRKTRVQASTKVGGFKFSCAHNFPRPKRSFATSRTVCFLLFLSIGTYFNAYISYPYGIQYGDEKPLAAYQSGGRGRRTTLVASDTSKSILTKGEHIRRPEQATRTVLLPDSDIRCPDRVNRVWNRLCSINFSKELTQILQSDSQVLNIIQIGAHTGWERNDPFTRGFTLLLESLRDAYLQKLPNLHYTMIEASPSNYVALEKSIQNQGKTTNCSFHTIFAGILPDSPTPEKDGETPSSEFTKENQGPLQFFSIRDTIDVSTGIDSSSGKQFPHWVSQISSFSKETVMKQSDVFTNNNLKIEDYIVETIVPTMSYTDLVNEVASTTTGSTTTSARPFFVLMDTEGLDCDILLSVSNLEVLPQFMLFEHKHCQKPILVETKKHLRQLGYKLIELAPENHIAYLPPQA